MKVRSLYGDGFWETKGEIYEVKEICTGPNPEGPGTMDWYVLDGNIGGDYAYCEPADCYEIVEP